jgi:protein unc-13
MNLYFKVKWFHGQYVADLPTYKDTIPEFPAWFIPFVMQWLNENDEISMDFLRGAYDRDKKDNFPQSSDHTKFSNSVVDIFTQLTSGLDVITKMECPNPEVKTDMMRRFAKTLNKVLLAYAEMVQRDFPKYSADEKVGCILMNNVQQLRTNLEKIYKNMGGENLDPTAAETLNNLQTKLNTVLEKLAAMFAVSLERSISDAMTELSSRLQALKGQAPITETLADDAEHVVEPLMDVMEKMLAQFVETCEKTVLKYMLKELWKMCIVSMEKAVVLPTSNKDNVSQSLKYNVGIN